jgi:hypothetical protein
MKMIESEVGKTAQCLAKRAPNSGLFLLLAA